MMMFFIPSLSAGLLVAALLLLQVEGEDVYSLHLLAGMLASAATVGFQITMCQQEQLVGQACFIALTVIAGYVAMHGFIPLLLQA